MDLPVSYGICDDKSTCSHMEKPPERSDDSSSITLSVIIRYTLSHDFYPCIPAYEEASADSTAK